MFEIFKSAVSKIKNKEKGVHKEEVKALSSIVALLVEAASVDGNIGDEEKSHISLILRKQLNIEETEAKKIQELFLQGKRTEAAIMVPDQFADEISLVGPKERIKERLEIWKDTPITSLLISTQKEKLREVAEIVFS